MNTIALKANVKKELWEFHKVLLWLPVVITSLILLMILVQYVALEQHQADNIMQALTHLSNLNAEEFNFDKIQEVSFGVSSGLFVPFLVIAGVVQFYYFTSCLFDERRDLSVYFWRSLPVSDATTIGVKLFTGALVIPAIFMLAASALLFILLIVALIVTVVLSVGSDISLWHIWGSLPILSNITKVWISLLPYTLWLLPLYAWVMLASMFAGKAPFLWAVIPVVLLVIIESMFGHMFHFFSPVIAPALLNYFAIDNNLIQQNAMQLQDVSLLPFSVLTDKVSLIGLVISAVLLYGVYWLRTNRSHG